MDDLFSSGFAACTGAAQSNPVIKSIAIVNMGSIFDFFMAPPFLYMLIVALKRGDYNNLRYI